MMYRVSCAAFFRFGWVILLAGSLLDVAAADFAVTNLADTGAGTLRSAIGLANITPGPDTISFNLPGSGVRTISLTTDLPNITDTVTIDGTTQSGYISTPVITLSGSANSFIGLRLFGNNCVVRGLCIGSFRSRGIIIFGVSNRIQRCFIGTDAAGKIPRPNGIGIEASDGSSHTTIGGPDAGNLISGNLDMGLCLLFSFGDIVQANFIGTDANGTNSIRNVNDGIVIDHANDAIVGGTGMGEGNLISGNGRDGIRLKQGSYTNFIRGNIIGLDANSLSSLPNQAAGIHCFAPNNTLGGGEAGARNLISGNAHQGIVLDSVQNCLVQGNWIGLNMHGKAVTNGDNGILISFSSDNTIGGRNFDEGNVICASAGAGVLLSGDITVGNALISNFVGVGPDGVTAYGNAAGVVVTNGASVNSIGTTASGNVISGNRGPGVQISGSQTAFNILYANRIGLAATGQTPVPNAGPGVDVFGSAGGTQIGNPDFGITFFGTGNEIAFNQGDGVLVRDDASSTFISANSIYANAGLGINLQPQGESPSTVTTNDLTDADGGPNHLQNFPVITNTVYASGLTAISGYLRSAANQGFRLEFFANNAPGLFGCGQGQFYLGTTNALTDGTGFAGFKFIAAGNFGEQFFTTTASSMAAETSEFSPAVPTLEGLLRITQIRRVGVDLQISFTSQFGTNYRLEVTSSLATPIVWSPVSGASAIPGTGAIVTVSDLGAASASPHFYRIREL
jgi:hypothetical protein